MRVERGCRGGRSASECCRLYRQLGPARGFTLTDQDGSNLVPRSAKVWLTRKRSAPRKGPEESNVTGQRKKQSKAKQNKTRQQNQTPGARGSLLRTPLHPLRLHLVHLHRFLLLVPAIPVLLNRGNRSSNVGTPQKSRAPPGCTSRPPVGRRRATSASPSWLPLWPSPTARPAGLSTYNRLNRWLNTEIVFRVAPPAVVVRSVIRALEVHAGESMP